MRVIFAVSGDAEGRVWLAANGGAGSHEGSVWQFFDQSDGLPHRVVHGVHRENNGTLWFACRTGLASWDGRAMEVHFAQENFRSIFKDDDELDVSEVFDITYDDGYVVTANPESLM